MTETLDSRTIKWVAAIPGDAPAGIDARYEPAHEGLRSEVALLESVSGGDPDWPKVCADASGLLSNTSKDILVACYLAYALYQTEGVHGLAVGLQTVARVTDAHWEGMFPPVKRARARANAITWLTERVEPALAETAVDASHRPAIEALAAAVKELADVVGQRFDDPSPAMRPLRDVVTRLELSLPAKVEAAPEAAAAPAPAAAPTPAAAAPSPSAEPASPAAGADAAEAPAAPVKADAPADHLAALRAPVASLVAAIAADAPAGTDARYDAEHEAVRTEVAKLESVSDTVVDWQMVVTQSESILKTKSKDFLIAVYYAAARMELNDLVGLAEGLVLLADVMDTYWEDGFPAKRREKARANAVSWLIDRTLPLADRTLTAGDRQAVERLSAAAGQLASVVRNRFEDHAPGVRPLTETVQRMEMSIPAPVAAPKPAAPAAAAPAAAAPAAAPPAAAAPKAAAASKSVALPDVGGEVADPAQITEFLQKVGASLHKASRSIFGVSPSDPVGYRLARVGLYLHLSAPPPVQSGQNTAVPAPPAEQVQQLEKLASTQNWAPLLEEAESALGPRRFWLDLQRYVALALGGLGHNAARDAVVQGTGALVRRMPELRDLAFADGTPFASSATLSWLDDEVVTSGGEGGGPADPHAPLYAEARKLAGAGKGSEALTLLNELASGAHSARDRFRARLAMAQACAVVNSHAAADGIYSALSEDAERFGIASWEPELAAQCFAGHYTSLKALANAARAQVPPAVENNNMTAKLAVVYGRLCAVDPVLALKLGG